MIVKTLEYAVTGAKVRPLADMVDQMGTYPFCPSKYVAGFFSGCACLVLRGGVD
ncbi:MAG: hypothetical protein JW990_10020 [Thermoleophilia bacterium]|nr:hypothetical protein [Thermoleophilia bacterium]